MAQFAVLVYAPTPADVMETPPEELEAHGKFGEQLDQLGAKIVSAQALQASTTATTIRNGLITDGPFTEAKEVLAGFFVLEARDLDHAVEVAKLNPATWRGGLEVRPLFAPPEG